MPAPLTLLVLAAGLGSRYRGPKQLEPMGPGGATLMDYSIYDAQAAGFSRVVFVIREEIAEVFERVIGRRYRKRLDMAVAYQRLADLPAGLAVPPGRTRPWGTTQAVLAAREQIPGPFAVLNADDFYGREALAAIGGFLRAEPAAGRYAVVGYRLEQTASAAGGVNRAVLERRSDGMLERAVEVRGLTWASEGRFRGEVEGAPRIVAADALVSMNLWGFTPAVCPDLAAGFERFLRNLPDDNAEYYLPQAVEELLRTGRARVAVLPTSSRWCGVTYSADRPWVEATLRELVAAGIYPEEL